MDSNVSELQRIAKKLIELNQDLINIECIEEHRTASLISRASDRIAEASELLEDATLEIEE